MPQMPIVLGIQGMLDQIGLLLSQSMAASAVTSVEDKQEAPLNLNGWYDQWGRLWQGY